MIPAYRSVAIEIDPIGTIDVPLTVNLLLWVEKTLDEAEKAQSWFRRKEKSLVDVYKAFAEPFLPESLDRDKIQPAFYPLFFSRVSGELMHSLNDSLRSTASTETPHEPTGGRTTEGRASAS